MAILREKESLTGLPEWIVRTLVLSQCGGLSQCSVRQGPDQALEQENMDGSLTCQTVILSGKDIEQHCCVFDCRAFQASLARLGR